MLSTFSYFVPYASVHRFASHRISRFVLFAFKRRRRGRCLNSAANGDDDAAALVVSFIVVAVALAK